MILIRRPRSFRMHVCGSHPGCELDLGVIDVIELAGVLRHGDARKPGSNAGCEIGSLGEHEEALQNGRGPSPNAQPVIARAIAALKRALDGSRRIIKSREVIIERVERTFDGRRDALGLEMIDELTFEGLRMCAEQRDGVVRVGRQGAIACRR